MIAKLPYPKAFGFLLVSGLFLATSCTKVDAGGTQRTERIEVEDFDKIEFHIGGQINYSQGNMTQVSLSCGEEALAGIDIYVKNKTLYIKRAKGYKVLNQENIVVDIIDDDTYDFFTCGSGSIEVDNDENYHFNEFNLKTSGSGSINVDYAHADRQYSKISGSGDITLAQVISNEHTSKISGSGSVSVFDLTTVDAIADISGSGDIYFFGNAENNDVDIHGSGEFGGYDFYTVYTDAFNCGSGRIRVRVSEKLDADLSGSGDLFYKGYPEIIKSVSGSGNIVDAN